MNKRRKEIEALQTDLANQQLAAVAKFKEFEEKLIRLQREKWSAEDHHSRTQSLLIDAHFEQIRQKIDEVIYNRYISLHSNIEAFVRGLINPNKTILNMTRQTYRDVIAQSHFFIKDHEERGTISITSPAIEYPVEDVQIIKISIPGYSYHVRVRAKDLELLKEYS